MKILFWRCDNYGAETNFGYSSLFKGLSNAFVELGHQVVYVSSGKVAVNKEVKTYLIRYSNFFRNLPEIANPIYNFRAYNEILKIIDEEKPDLIYQLNSDFFFNGAMIKKKTGLPFFLQCDAIGYWMKKNWGKLYLPKLLIWAEEMQWASADHIFVVSSVIKEQLNEIALHNCDITVNPSAVDSKLFNHEYSQKISDKYGLDGKYVVGFSGSFAQWHGIEIFAKTVKLLKEKIPNVVFMMIGDGQLRDRVDEIITHDDVADNVIITGIVNYEEVPEYLSVCNVLASPCVPNQDDSAFFNSPLKLFEYMSMGKPIVASDIGQQSEVLEHKQNGYLHSHSSPEVLADAILDLYNNKELADKLSINARQTALDKHDWKVNAQKIIDAYEEMKS